MRKSRYVQAKIEIPMAESFEELAENAIKKLQGERGFHVVCGPITSGGLGDISLNLDVLSAVICGVEKTGKRVFDQTPYEQALHYLAEKWKVDNGDRYCFPILDIFYCSLFESGVIAEGWFIPGWELSTGAQWERKKITEKKLLIHR